MANNLSSSQLKELRDCFDLFDRDKSGSISVHELSRVCQSLNITINDGEVENLMKLMDKDSSGSVEFQEFVNVMAQEFYRSPSESELEAAFDYFDKDNSGFINEDELYQAMSRFKGTITRKEIQRIIESTDKDKDHKINKKG